MEKLQPKSRDFSPRPRRANEREIIRTQESFSGGMYADQSIASKIPKNAISYLKNFKNKGYELEGMGGSKLWSETTLPLLFTGFTTGTDSISGNKRTFSITWAGDPSILATYVGAWFVWPDGRHEKIIEVDVGSPTYLITYTRDSVSEAPITGTGNVRGQVYLFYFHKTQRKYVLHIDTRLFVSADVALSSWSQVICTSNTTLSNAPSICDEYQNWIFIGNAGYVFKYDLSEAVPTYTPLNTPVPQVLLTGTSTGSTAFNKTQTPYIRRMIYSCSILSSTGYRNRTTSGVIIKRETGTTQVNSDGKDYADIYTNRPVGLSDTTYDYIQTLSCTIAGGVDYRSPANWSISDARLRATINGTTSDVSVDLSGSVTMAEIASRIESALAANNSDWAGAGVSVKYDSNQKFKFMASNEGGTFTILTTVPAVPSGAVQIADNSVSKYLTSGGSIPATTSPKWSLSLMDGRSSADGAAVSAGLLTLPSRGYSHYTIYASLDIGDNGIDPINGTGNDSELLIWDADIRACNAFVVNTVDVGYYSKLTATKGTFYRCDEGCKIWVNGVAGKILCLCDSGGNQVYTATSAYALVNVNYGNHSGYVALIGDEGAPQTIRGFIGSQSGTAVSLSIGTVLAGDTGKTIYWSDGSESIITSVSIVGNSYTVNDSTTRTGLAFAVDPVSRRYNDTVRDESLRTRISAKPARWRGHSALPTVDMVVIASGFLFAVDYQGKVVYTSPMPELYEEAAGFYYAGVHQATIQDQVRAMVKTTDSLVLFGTSTIKQIDLNQFNSDTIKEIGISISMITGVTDIDKNIGVSDFTSVCDTELGGIFFISSEPAIRITDGKSVNKTNYAESRIMEQLKSYDSKYVMFYDRFNGFTMWFRDTQNAYYPMTKCWRYGTSNEQGNGFCEITGLKHLWPEEGIAPVKIIDAGGMQRVLCLDGDSGLVYEMYTRVGPISTTLKFFRKYKEGIDKTVNSISVVGGLLRVVTSSAHNFVTGDSVEFYGIGGTTQLNGLTFTVTKIDSTTVDLQGTNVGTYGAYSSGGYVFKAGTDIAPSVKFAEDTGTLEKYYLDHISHSIYVRPFDGRIGQNGFDTNGYPTGLTMTDTLYADGDPTTAQATAAAISLPKQEIHFDRRIMNKHRLQEEITFNKSEVKVSGRSAYFVAKDIPDTPANRKMGERDYQLSLWSPTVWLSRGSNLLLERVGGSTIAGSVTSAAGPDGKTNSAMLIGGAGISFTIPGGSSILLWYKAGYSISGVSLTAVSNNGTWYLGYATFVSPWSLTLPVGYVFDFRVYASLPSAAALTYYYNDVINNAGKEVLPRW